MNCNHKENAVSLLRAVPNALRGLHDAFGFDFEQPFTVLRLSGSWTVNTIQKQLAAQGFSRNVFSALLLDCRDSQRIALKEDWRIAILNRGMVYATFDHYRDKYDLPRWRDFGYCEPFDKFYRKGDFENVRKSGAPVYVIAQEPAYFRAKQEAKALDPARRYRVESATWDYNYTVNAVPLDSKGLPVKYRQPAHRPHEEPAPADCFDKSGYLVFDRRENLRRRAQALREERAKAAYLASGKQQEQIEELCGLIAIRQMELVDALTVANTSQEFMAVAKAIGEYSWHSFSSIVSNYETFCEKTRNKSYPSIEDSDRAYNKIKTSLLIELKRIAAA